MMMLCCGVLWAFISFRGSSLVQMGVSRQFVSVVLVRNGTDKRLGLELGLGLG